MKNQLITGNIPNELRFKNTPFKFEIHKRLEGKSLVEPLLRFEDYSSLKYIGRSGNFYHFIGDSKCILVCTIVNK